ncbi:ABC transporter ATP-binding protein [Sulfuricella sp. T08]|uniref:ABC transporter ATP-binding protein n=1 Tax=Sulfuricella sp. T08 TaxID=1632857 RepID=UPI0006179A0F|nr:ABC transporter ATP-binding protein [Sulfuricella sp. T08]GAO37045.1 ABC transporter ATP-binding protein [Sulfuricella sp. T08]
MNEIAISVKNLTKTYRIFGHPGDRIKQALTFGRMRFHREFTALRDVSFEIKKGETVGIIGRNGSGKSTLLQLICGILKPTSGEVEVNGRVSALLELGAGFNPEFTGRENVYFQGAVMGIPKKEMVRRFDDIATFSDIGEFIDQPVRIYSSGMYVRLAFATAIHSAPDTLIIDEALSVGDEPFQRKCFERIRQIREQGCTIIYVSHNMASVVELCDHALLLEQGKLTVIGNPKFVSASYLKNLNRPYATDEVKNNPKLAYQEQETACFDQTLIPESTVSYTSLGAQIINPRILSLDGKCVNLLHSGEEYIYAYEAQFNVPAKCVRFGMMIKTVTGYELGGLLSHPADTGISVECGTTLSQRFRFRCNLLSGTYFLNAGITCLMPDKGEVYLHRVLDAAMFKITQENGSIRSGTVDISSSFSGLMP